MGVGSWTKVARFARGSRRPQNNTAHVLIYPDRLRSPGSAEALGGRFKLVLHVVLTFFHPPLLGTNGCVTHGRMSLPSTRLKGFGAL